MEKQRLGIDTLPKLNTRRYRTLRNRSSVNQAIGRQTHCIASSSTAEPIMRIDIRSNVESLTPPAFGPALPPRGLLPLGIQVIRLLLPLVSNVLSGLLELVCRADGTLGSGLSLLSLCLEFLPALVGNARRGLIREEL